MEAKEYAKMFGGFSTEKRVNIISALMDAGPDGASLIDLSRLTGLSVIEIGNTIEALFLMNMIKISIKGENKLLIANFAVLDGLFEAAYNELGPGRDKIKPANIPQLTAEPGASA